MRKFIRVNKNNLLLYSARVLVVLLLVAGAISIYNWHIDHKRIKIGDQIITNQDIDNYQQHTKELKKTSPSIIIGKDLRQDASDRLIFNAALKKEAAERHITVSDEELLQVGGQTFNNDTDKQNYTKKLHTEAGKPELVNLENQAYRDKLANLVLATKQILTVNVMLDTPYFSQLPQDKVQVQYDAAKSKLNKEIMPLLKSGASKETIAKHVDTVWYQKNDNSKENGDLVLYMTKPASAVDIVEGYRDGTTRFNDIDDDSWVHGDVGKIYKTTDKLDKLNNVGDVTDVFASKSGAYMAARLESKSGGKYNNWDDFIKSYKNKYVGKKLGVKIDVKAGIENAVVTGINVLTSPGLEKAWAEVPDASCTTHFAKFTLVAFDSQENRYLSGAKISFTRRATDTSIKDGVAVTPGDTCGDVGTAYAVSTGGPNATAGSWNRTGGDGNEGDNTIHSSCWTTAPEMNVVTHPAGYQTPGYQSSDQGEPFRWASIPDGNVYHGELDNYSGQSDSQFGTGAGQFAFDGGHQGWPTWSSGTTNEQNIIIVLRYHKLACTGSGCSTGCTGSSCSPGCSVNCGSSSGSTVAQCTSTRVDAGLYSGYDTRAAVYMSGVTGDTSGLTTSLSGNPFGYNSGHVTLNYTPTNNGNNGGHGPEPTVHVIRDFFYTGSTGSAPFDGSTGHRQHNTWYQYSDGWASAGPCYDAACSIDSVDTNLPGGYASPGSTVTFHATIYNNQPGSHTELRNGLEGQNLSLVNSGGDVAFASNPPGGTIYVNQSSTVAFTATAPPSGTSFTATAKAQYVAHFWFGSDCSFTVPMSQPPRINADIAHCGGDFAGWAYSPNYSGSSIGVYIYVDNANVGYAVASDPRSDVNAAFGIGGNHGWHWTIPSSYFDGLDHVFKAVAIDPDNIQNTTSNEITMTGCGNFVLSPSVSGANLDNPEDPSSFTAFTKVTPSYPGWAAAATRPAVPGSNSNSTTKNGASIGGPYGSDTSFTTRDYTLVFSPITSVSPGDEYCGSITVSPAKGLIDRTGVIVRTDQASDSKASCDHVTDKPYFKVFGGSVSAGGAFNSAGTGCTTPAGEGILSGYNNNTTSTYNFGASAQLTALAMAKITGVASNQTNYNKLPTALSFANTTNIGALDNYDPGMGGDFGPSVKSCLTTASLDPTKPQTPLPSTVTIGSATMDADGQYIHNTDTSLLTIDGGTVRHRMSIFTKGNVVISNNIKYSDTGWSKDNVPTLEIHAEGNIYIDKSVDTLDGIYIAEKSGGKISTCSNGEQLVQNTSTYFSDCSKQLVVHGSFVADHINLMRTFGTMRDEKPTITAAGAQLGLSWSNAGNVLGGVDADGDGAVDNNCVNTLEPIPGDTGPNIWDNNYLCIPASTGIKFGWTCHTSWTSNVPSGCHIKYSQLQATYPHCTVWDVSPYPDTETWGDDALCWSGGDANTFKFRTSGSDASNYCIAITEPQDGLWKGGYICEAKAAPGGLQVPTSLTCTNGAPIFKREVRGTSATSGPNTPHTCASEVFDFSPEQYLAHPAIAPPNYGAPVWDSVTSLPPVL